MGVCDFCSGGVPRWSYPTRDFVVEPLTTRLHAEGMPGAGSEGNWAACDTCHALIERTDREGLTLRVASIFARQYSVPVQMLLEPLGELHGQFWSNREGKPIPINRPEEE